MTRWTGMVLNISNNSFINDNIDWNISIVHFFNVTLSSLPCNWSEYVVILSSECGLKR